MDHRYIEENNLIERYVLGRLPVAEQIDFEEHFSSCAECVAELESADDFGSALRAAAADDARRVVADSLAAALVRWFRRPLAPLVLGVLLLAVTLPSVWLISENQRLASDVESLRQPRSNVPSFLLTMARDAAAPTPVLSVPPGQPWMTLMIEVDDSMASYGAKWRDGDGRVLWQEAHLVPNLWSVLQLTFPVDLLPPGDYSIQLEGYDTAGRSEPVGIYRFRIPTP